MFSTAEDLTNTGVNLQLLTCPELKKKKKNRSTIHGKKSNKKQTNYDLTIEKIIMFFKSADLEHDGKYLF